MGRSVILFHLKELDLFERELAGFICLETVSARCLVGGIERESVTYLEMQFLLSAITGDFSHEQRERLLFTNIQPVYYSGAQYRD